VPAEVIASGGALLRSAGWTQMMADALGRPVTASTEPEASSRGAALYALQRLGLIPNLDALPASTGGLFSPRENLAQAYTNLREQQRVLFKKLFTTEPRQ